MIGREVMEEKRGAGVCWAGSGICGWMERGTVGMGWERREGYKSKSKKKA